MKVGVFKYVIGWFAIVYNDKTGLVERYGPFNTEEQAETERKKHDRR